MRHRMLGGVSTGLGNPSPCLLHNEWTNDEELNNSIKSMLSEAIDLWFADIEGCDFEIYKDDKEITILFGIEPAYMYDKIKVFCISTLKEVSFRQTGISFGAYGSGIRSTIKQYEEFQKHCKFTRFVDKWSEELNKHMK